MRFEVEVNKLKRVMITAELGDDNVLYHTVSILSDTLDYYPILKTSDYPRAIGRYHAVTRLMDGELDA